MPRPGPRPQAVLDGDGEGDPDPECEGDGDGDLEGVGDLDGVGECDGDGDDKGVLQRLGRPCWVAQHPAAVAVQGRRVPSYAATMPAGSAAAIPAIASRSFIAHTV